MHHASIIFDTPLWTLLARATETYLIELSFSQENDSTLSAPRDTINTILIKTQSELAEYFAWKRKVFTLPLAPAWTPFQKSAWKALEKIPYGETRSYKEEAILAWNPKAIRAIWGANNKNPIVIIIPCHRVIWADGSLVGYGGGIERKKWLLDFEKSQI